MLPSFVVIGAAKAGTTSLHAYLRAHPQVFMSSTKELNYFIEEIGWPRGQDWYESNFDEAVDDVRAGRVLAVGEASPLYTAAQWYAGVPERMHACIRDARLVYVVRHPIERMRSHYLQHLEEGLETRSPERAFREWDGYLRSSQYAWQLSRFVEHFPSERILVLRNEELRADRGAVLRRLFAFLGVDEGWQSPALSEEHHRSVDKEVRPPAIVAMQRSRLYGAVGRLTPAPVRHLYGRLTSRPADPAAIRLSEPLERSIADRLRPDVEELRDRWLGPGFDGWGLLD